MDIRDNGYIRGWVEKVPFCIFILSLLFLLPACEEEGEPAATNPAVNEVTGTLVDLYGCKGAELEAADETPLDQDCIEYTYCEDGILLIKHINSGFNCCPLIRIKVKFEDDVITIVEKEIEGLCDCLCLFDLDLEIKYLSPRAYKISVIEPYVRGDEEKLEFTVDLASSPSGKYCVKRKNYPWGY
jgi:hypothetical protein